MNTISTRNVQANENGRGNLAATEVRCTCGYVESTTLLSEVHYMVAAHQTWHSANDEARKLAERSRRASRILKRNADPFGFKRAGLLK